MVLKFFDLFQEYVAIPTEPSPIKDDMKIVSPFGSVIIGTNFPPTFLYNWDMDFIGWFEKISTVVRCSGCSYSFEVPYA